MPEINLEALEEGQKVLEIGRLGVIGLTEEDGHHSHAQEAGAEDTARARWEASTSQKDVPIVRKITLTA